MKEAEGMRKTRIRRDSSDTWHHCFNRVAGSSLDRPLGDAEKEMFVRILIRVSKLYTVRVAAYQIMSNHFHLLLYAPTEEPGPEETCQRYGAFHDGTRTIEPHGSACRQWQARCRDISWFMRHLQHLFTAWYNRTRAPRRRGSLWADRFKNTILESGLAVWSCWTYIENNPVRAGIVETVADYRFCSHGIWHQTGCHPFEENVLTVMVPMLSRLFGLERLAEIRDHLDRALAEKADREHEKRSFSLTIWRRVRHWTSGLVIGSELFVREVMRCARRDSTPPRIAHSGEGDEALLFVWPQIRWARSG
ncbi:MAG: hypothetical protein KA248_03010 [Kiritimatiellae bacterium]|nr:hypothetical protein [Kiritimatiellia bacterium]